MDHNFGCAFTRQSPVETDASSASLYRIWVSCQRFPEADFGPA